MNMENIEEITKILDEMVNELADKDINFKIISLSKKLNDKIFDMSKKISFKTPQELKTKYVELLERITKMLEEVDTNVTTSE